MSDYALAWHAWLASIDGHIPDALLAGVSVALLSTVVLSKLALLIFWRFRPSLLLASADACMLAWSCSRISNKFLVFKTTPEHVFLHYALAVYAISNLVQMWGVWKALPKGQQLEVFR